MYHWFIILLAIWNFYAIYLFFGNSFPVPPFYQYMDNNENCFFLAAWQMLLWLKLGEKCFFLFYDKKENHKNLSAAYYDQNKDLYVAANASQNGLGAVLHHLGKKGKKQTISYASLSMTVTEKVFPD